ncbi:MAG: dTMP kinase [Promethearchaeati archaeon SRVP18_Atabeyarchaeia-1]
MLEAPGRRLLRRGVLVALEGIDGAGKTTQSKRLRDRLDELGFLSSFFHEPTDGEWGKKIRNLAKKGRDKIKPMEELDFFLRDRIEDVRDNIKPALEKKSVVVMDRYYFSNVAYQGALGLDPDYVERVNRDIAPEADITLILDISPEVALRRIVHSRNSEPNHFERRDYLEKVRRIFLGHFSGRQNVRVINGDDKRSPGEIADEIWSIVDPVLQHLEEKGASQTEHQE